MKHLKNMTAFGLSFVLTGSLCACAQSGDSSSDSDKYDQEYIETTLNLANNEEQE